MGFLPKNPGFCIYMYTKGLFGETDHVSKYINIIILSQTLPWTACLASGRQQEHPRSRMYYVNSWFYILYFHFAYDLAEPAHWKPLIPKNLDAWAQRMVKTYKYNNFHWFGSEEIWIRLFNSWMIPNMKKNQPKSGPGKMNSITNKQVVFVFFFRTIWFFLMIFKILAEN